MAQTLKGKGIKWAIAGLTFTGGIASATSDYLPQSVGYARTSDRQEIKNGLGECVAVVYYNEKGTFNISVIPAASGGTASSTAADSSVDAWTPAPGTTVTITDANGTVIDGNNSGKFNVVSSKQNRTNTNAVMVDLELENYAANDVTTTNT